MRLILFLLRESWRIVLLAGLVGALSGVASVGLVAMILRTLQDPNASSLVPLGLFAALCVVVLVTRIGSQLLLSRLTHHTISSLRLGLCRRILSSPLKHLEEIGSHRMLASLTGDVNVITQTMNGIPVLAVNLVVLFCGCIYLGMLSPGLLLGALVFCGLAVASYIYSDRFARRYVNRSRQAQDSLMKHIRILTDGLKELKTHHERRQQFVEQGLMPAEAAVRDNVYVGDCLHDAAITWGRLTFFIALGLLLFAWPRISDIDRTTLTGYTVVILYLMSPLEQIMAWLPFLGWASSSVSQIERLGLMLDEKELENPQVTPIANWDRIDLAGVTHTYQREGREQPFVLGPIDLQVCRGQIVFIVGGNGSGKTTLAKLITGLYLPEEGELRLDGRSIDAENRESYRQLFSVVFDDPAVFENLWGLDAAGLKQRADEYLRQLQLDQIVKVSDGAYSTTSLSRGQRKRLALLTAYLEDRSIYLFDEWAADQDPVFRKVFYLQILPDLKRRGKTVVAVTHDDRYFANADRLIKLEEGKIVDAFRHELHT